MKKRFIGAYISWHDNDLIQREVIADNEVDALRQLLLEHCGEEDRPQYANDLKEFDTSEKMKSHAFDCDCMISAYEVVNKLTKIEYLNLLADKLSILKSRCRNKYYLETIQAENGAIIMVNHTHDGITVEKTTDGIRRSLHLTDRPFRYKEHTQNRDFLIDYMNDIIESDVEEVMMYLGQII